MRNALLGWRNLALAGALAALLLTSLAALGDPYVPQLQCVIMKNLVYVEYNCVSSVSQCGTTWPFGLEELQLWHYEKWCQWWLCDPIFGLLCTPVGDSWLDREWDRVKAYFRGCGCDPGGDPIPYGTTAEPPVSEP